MGSWVPRQRPHAIRHFWDWIKRAVEARDSDINPIVRHSFAVPSISCLPFGLSKHSRTRFRGGHDDHESKSGFSLLMAAAVLPLAAQFPVKCSSRQLSAHPFVTGQVSLTITSLSGYKAFDREQTFSGRARVEITVEKKGTSFTRFDPQDLSFVGKDGIQVFPIFQRNLANDTLPMSLRFAPGARASMEYALTGRLTFPAKLYFGDTLVAEVSE